MEFFSHFKRSPPPSRKISTGNAGNLQPNGHLSSPTTGVGARNNRSRSRSPAIRKVNGAAGVAAATVVATIEPCQVGRKIA